MNKRIVLSRNYAYPLELQKYTSEKRIIKKLANKIANLIDTCEKKNTTFYFHNGKLIIINNLDLYRKNKKLYKFCNINKLTLKSEERDTVTLESRHYVAKININTKNNKNI